MRAHENLTRHDMFFGIRVLNGYRTSSDTHIPRQSCSGTTDREQPRTNGEVGHAAYH